MSVISYLRQIRELRIKLRGLDYRITALESLHENEAGIDEEKIMELLIAPVTITGLSEGIDRQRTWVSALLSRLVREGGVKRIDKMHEPLVQVYK